MYDLESVFSKYQSHFIATEVEEGGGGERERQGERKRGKERERQGERKRKRGRERKKEREKKRFWELLNKYLLALKNYELGVTAR